MILFMLITKSQLKLENPTTQMYVSLIFLQEIEAITLFHFLFLFFTLDRCVDRSWTYLGFLLEPNRRGPQFEAGGC